MDLLGFLKSSDGARKVFGKQELKIIEKQVRGVKMTQSERNRLSRDIRAKLRFIRDASAYSDEFSLKRASKLKKTVAEAVDTIKRDPLAAAIDEIILFGSASKNDITFRSDIDIAVKFKSIDTKESTTFLARILGRVDSGVDVQVYNQLPEEIRKEIDEGGRVLYKR